jgi:hypothetical protein
VSLDSKLRVLASFLDAAQPMDDYTRTALFQWFLYLSQAAAFDRPTYSEHLPGAWKLLSRTIATASPAAHETQPAIVALKLDALIFIWYGVIRAACRARHAAAVSLATQCIETVAGVSMPNDLCALYLASGALIDGIDSAFAQACDSLLVGDDGVLTPPPVTRDTGHGSHPCDS